MNKNYSRGLFILIGVLSLFGVVFAINFHTSEDIESGNFNGNYIFTGNFKLNNSDSLCNNSNEGGLKYNNNSIFVCNNNVWNKIN